MKETMKLFYIMVEIIRFLITFFQSFPSTDKYSHLIFNFLVMILKIILSREMKPSRMLMQNIFYSLFLVDAQIAAIDSDRVVIIMLQLLRCISLCSGSSLKINLPLTTELLCD
jgi:hypothetical protein